MPPGITRMVQGESDLLDTLTRTQVIGGEMSTIWNGGHHVSQMGQL
jgi:hypothetical protein